MKALDLAAINLSAPYSVWQKSERDYLFRTDFGLVYKIGFMDDDTIWPSGAYQFLIINESNRPSPNDTKLRQTIFCIVEAFFQRNPEILLYLCETGDGKQALRSRLFIRWFKEYSSHKDFYFDTIEMEAEGVENFAAIIVQKSNPRISQIISEFNEVVEELRKPEE